MNITVIDHVFKFSSKTSFHITTQIDFNWLDCYLASEHNLIFERKKQGRKFKCKGKFASAGKFSNIYKHAGMTPL